MKIRLVTSILILAATSSVWADGPELLTPKAGPAPQIHGPKVHGCRPGHPLLYRIPATGNRPMTFTAEGLPSGLTLDGQTGILRGAIAARGEFAVSLRAVNDQGESRRAFKIVCGDTLALTPPMGWNSWYIHYHRVKEEHLREAADQMIASGMADYGYQYVNIDDCWMKKKGDTPYRDAQGGVLPNGKFPDMQGMVEYIHSKGLKAGTYTSPGPWTCADYVGAYGHEAEDARQFARWGFDFLKYDWCSYSQVAGGKELEHLKKPYQRMWEELQKVDRDIVFNLCQYGMGDVWKWGAEVGHCWRTTGDLGLEAAKDGLPGCFKIGLANAKRWEYAKPGAWNDPDYILVGWVGDARHMGEGHPTSLLPDEQYAYMAMWCLMAAPLIFSGDMAKLDPFTLNVLCNAEVIDVNQDPLGRQAKIVRQTANDLVLVKDLEDGSKAVGLFNLGKAPATLRASGAELGLAGKQRIRDLWRGQDLEPADNLEATVPPHGVLLVNLRSAN